jgi:transcriptional regulator GlxA family with amidase domain
MDWLAGQVCLSRAQLHRLFTDQMGKTPRAYRDGLRVQAMVRLLAETDLPVADVACRAGWSPDRAATVFKEAVGMTPGTYREMFHRRAGAASDPQDRVMFPADLLVFEH